MKVIDAFLFFNELRMLDLRLNILNDYVDKFIIVESSVGFSGKPKPMVFEKNKHLFEKFLPKIVYFPIDGPPKSDASYQTYIKNATVGTKENEYEVYQRNYIASTVQNEPDDDIIFISDLDEIWDPEKIFPILNSVDNTKIYKPASRICYFYFNLVASPHEWIQPIFLKCSLLKKLINEERLVLTEDVVRNWNLKIELDKCVILENAGWHFSFTEDVIYKIGNSGHTQFDKPPFNTKEYINTCIKNKINPFHGCPMTVIPKEELNSYLPTYILDNMEKYKEFILTE